MLTDNEPWFIDYQGGRKGAPQYDLASLLYDAKIPMKQENRDEMAEYFLEKFCIPAPVIGGLIFSTIITMIIVPVIYRAFASRGERNKKMAVNKKFAFLDE